MIERRHQWLLDCWTLVAKQRASRPDEYASSVVPRAMVRCPFCRGNEADTLESLALYGGEGLPGHWDVRVTPNKFPALRPFAAGEACFPATQAGADQSTADADAASEELVDESDGLFPRGTAAGVHELVIEAPHHSSRFADLTERQASYTVEAWRDRLRLYAPDPRLAYGLVFRNSGLGGGASLEHVHSQILCTPWIPSAVRTELRQFRRWRERGGFCLLCAMVEAELRAERRVVARTDNLLAFCPYASRFAWETWIVPQRHAGRFELASDVLVVELAALLRHLITKVEGLPKLRGYNLWLHTAPFFESESMSADDFHWHIEIAPRTTGTAGFETGGGDYIITVAPEDAAEHLRA